MRDVLIGIFFAGLLAFAIASCVAVEGKSRDKHRRRRGF